MPRRKRAITLNEYDSAAPARIPQLLVDQAMSKFLLSTSDESVCKEIVSFLMEN